MLAAKCTLSLALHANLMSGLCVMGPVAKETTLSPSTSSLADLCTLVSRNDMSLVVMIVAAACAATASSTERWRVLELSLTWLFPISGRAHAH